MFSYALLDVLRNGDLHRPLQLSLRDIKELAEDRLAALPEKNAPRPGLHSPDQSEGDVADVPFFPNLGAQKERMRQIEEERRHQAEEAERARRMEEERQRRVQEEQIRQAEEERARKAREKQARQIEEERQRQAEIERKRITPNETISPVLSGPGSTQSSNTAAAGSFFPLISPPIVPGNQPGQEPSPGVVVASRITRRRVVVGLGIAGLAVTGGGITWLLLTTRGSGNPVATSLSGSLISVDATNHSVTLNVNGSNLTVKGLTDQQVAALQGQVGKVVTLQLTENSNGTYTIVPNTEILIELSGSLISVDATNHSITLSVNGQNTTVKGLTDQQVVALQGRVGTFVTLQVTRNSNGTNTIAPNTEIG